MDSISASSEKYLRAIYELTEEGTAALRIRVAERLSVAASSTGETVARLEDRGLVKVDDRRALHLTETGEQVASRVLRRHRLAECFLAATGLSLDTVHPEADRWQHVMSVAVERRFLEILGHPRESPFGNPLPALNELGVAGEPTPFLHGVQRLGDVPGLFAGTVPVQTRRIGEFAQQDGRLIASLELAGLLVGGRADAAAGADGVLLTRAHHRILVPAALTPHLYVVT